MFEFFFLSQLLIEPHSLLRCSLAIFFPLVFISFPFLLSPLPYYAITFFPLNPPACSRDAGTSKRWRSCSLCIPSVLHLSFKNCFWKIPPSMCLQKKKSQHPCVSYKVQEVAVLTGVHGRGQDRTPCPHPQRGLIPFFFFFLKQVDSILPETKPKKAPGRGKARTRWPTPQGSPHQTALTGHHGKEIRN